ncbi:MAG: hypothetical protein ACPGRZ_17165 [Alphaproteobacteria bacterium]
MTAGALLAIAAALPVPAAAQTAASGDTSALARYNGVWDAYGGISCREGDAAPEVLTIRDGRIEGTVQTTDNATRMCGKINRFGQLTVFVNGHYTLMEFNAVIHGEEGYGTAIADGDDVDCDGQWALKRRADPNVAQVHRSPRGGAPVKIAAGFESQAWRWSTQNSFEEKYRAFTRIAEDKRIRAVVESR